MNAPGVTEKAKQQPGWLKALELILFGGLLGIAFVWLVHWSGLGISFNSDHEQPNFPAGGPAEFLYLDSGRAVAYLAQVEGGTFNSERLTQKLTNTLGGKLGLRGVEVSGTKQEESFTEREVTPTAASIFFQLLAALKAADRIETIRLGQYESDVLHHNPGEGGRGRRLSEGQFVLFSTHALKSPRYLNPYLVVRQTETLSALFPNPSLDPAKRSRVEAQREAARKFARQVGDNPRIVFALQREGGGPRAPAKYLLPLRYQQLTDERSLFKYGGGDFTVVGKVVRIFPETKQDETPAYIDSPTRETWEQALRQAPGELLCRIDPNCAAVHGPARKRQTEEIRRQLADQVLPNQTEIETRGAVILPVAIYK